MTKKFQEGFDSSFYQLAKEVTQTIALEQDGSSQKEQVEELIKSETMFRETVLKYRQSTEIYKKFLQHICIKQKNILSARPYFRETAVTFSKQITPAIKNNDIEKLKTFSINYQLISFIKDNWLGPFPKRAEQLFNRVKSARNKLINLNMPLAINRAKLFYRMTPKGSLTLMDMIGICGMGLMSGVDKYVGAYSPVFRSVIIGRCVGNLIDAYSETTLHFFPKDKRILYKAHAIRGRQGIEDIKELTNAVNISFKQDEKDGKSVPGKIGVGELNALLSASTTVSADATTDEEGYGVYSYTEDPNPNIEEKMLYSETLKEVLTSAKNLSNIQRKVLLLKGIKL
jgi:DNA-directed RNA polymerase specialized sigma subunit